MEQQQTPSWGITPVPERLRVLGLFDLTLLWGNLSVSLLVIVAAAGLVPMLSLPQALLAIVIGALAGNVLLGLAGAIGADARVPGMVVLRAPLGRRGSYAPTVLNVAQNLGWSTFELIIISTAAAALSERVFGFATRWLWALVFGAISLALGLLGPIGFVRRYLKQVRRLGGRGLDRLPDLVGARQGRTCTQLWRPAGHRAASRSARGSTS